MKNVTLALIGLFITGTLFGAIPFSSSSTGYDWKSAPQSYKVQYCELMAKAQQENAPGITGAYIFSSLSSFFDSDDPGILKQRIVQMVALTVAAHASSR